MASLRHLRSCDFRTARSISGDSRRALAAAAVLLVALVAAAPGARADTEPPRTRCARLRADARAPRAAAIAACDEALAVSSQSTTDLLAAVLVRVARPEVPTMDELIRAQLLAEAAARLAPDRPEGALARLALARRWGDPALVALRAEELTRLAPADPRAVAALAALRRPAGSPARTLGLIVIAALVGLTLVDALRRRWRRGRAAGTARTHRALPFVAVLVVGVAVSARVAHAGPAFPIDDADPARVVPSATEADAHPLEFAYYLQEVTARAAAASARGDHAAAARYYDALARAVPDSAIAPAKRCSESLAAGDREGALAACRAALALPGVRAEDFVRFGDLVLAQAAPSPAALADVAAAAQHLREAEATRILGLQLDCRLGVRTADARRLESCSGELAHLVPGDASTHVFAWTLALQRGDHPRARAAIEQARATGLDASALARMEAATRAHGETATSNHALVAAGLVALLGGLVLALRALRRRQWATTTSGNA